MEGFTKRRSTPHVYTFNSFLTSLEHLSTALDNNVGNNYHYGGGNSNEQLLYVLKDDNARLKSQNQKIIERNEELQYELDNLKAVNNDLKYNCEFMQNKFKSDIAVTEAVINEQSNKMKELTSTIAKQKELIESLHGNISNYEKLTNKMKEAIELQKQDITLKQQQQEGVNVDDKMKKELEEKDAVIQDLAGKLEDTLNKLDYFVNERKEFVNQQHKVEELIQEKDKMINLLQQALKQSKSGSSGNVSARNDKSDNDNNALASYKEMYEIEKQKNNELVNTMEDIETKVTQLLSSQKEMKNFYESQIQSLQDQLKSNNTQQQQQQPSLTTPPNDKDNNQQQQHLKEYINNLESQVTELKDMNEYLLNQMSKVPELEEQFKKLFDDMLRLQKENDLLKQTLTSPEKKHLNLDTISKSKEGSSDNKSFSDSAHKSAKPNLALYAILPDKLVSYNFSKGQMITFKPEKYDEFIADYIEDGSITYNSLSSLLVLTSKNFNELYYYTNSDNTFTKLFTFKENHKNGCIFIDNTSNNMYALGGEYTNKVEKFSLEQMEFVACPDMNEQRSHFTCCLIDDNMLYVFFGYSRSQNKCLDSIECIDLQNTENGWSMYKANNPSYELRCMSVLPYTKDQMIIVGGETSDGTVNRSMIRFNGVDNKLEVLTKDEFYNKKENKPFLFSKNAMFATYIGGNDLIYCNMDDDMYPHFFDTKLNYETIFF